MSAFAGRLPGFVGPFPPPLLMKALLFSSRLDGIGGDKWCQARTELLVLHEGKDLVVLEVLAAAKGLEFYQES
jgi:hypothetical protein